MALKSSSEKQDKTALRAVHIPVGGVTLHGDLALPPGATGIVLFAHGSGSSRHSPRNRYVAEVLQHDGLATLLFDLLTTDEEAEDVLTRRLRFDIHLLTQRLIGATEWMHAQPEAAALRIGYFGASTGAAAALQAAAACPDAIRAVVSRGGRPDMAADVLPRVRAATLLIVGGDDTVVLEMNQRAYDLLTTQKRLSVVPLAGHLFQEPGTLEQVARLACAWFLRYLNLDARQ
ncbi:MAG: dienelactone hydrolase family protein [Anaerolineae bacterium]|nr:dienelactone hydrolase family protein [Anaerolineae bacterium]